MFALVEFASLRPPAPKPVRRPDTPSIVQRDCALHRDLGKARLPVGADHARIAGAMVHEHGRRPDSRVRCEGGSTEEARTRKRGPWQRAPSPTPGYSPSCSRQCSIAPTLTTSCRRRAACSRLSSAGVRRALPRGLAGWKSGVDSVAYIKNSGGMPCIAPLALGTSAVPSSGAGMSVSRWRDLAAT